MALTASRSWMAIPTAPAPVSDTVSETETETDTATDTATVVKRSATMDS